MNTELINEVWERVKTTHPNTSKVELEKIWFELLDRIAQGSRFVNIPDEVWEQVLSKVEVKS